MISIVFLAIAGVVALRIGLRGRRIDDHPVCAGCGFDLTGRPESSSRCSECGANLDWSAAVRIGNRQRRAGWVYAGVLMLVTAIAAGGLVVADDAGKVHWVEHAPVKWLLIQARIGTAAARDSALKELLGRANGGRLSGPQAADAVAVGRGVQGDTGKAWNPIWGDLIEFERANGRASDEQWARYGKQALQNGIGLHVRSIVRLGDPLPYSMDLMAARCATRSVLQVTFGIGFSDLASDHSRDSHGLNLSYFIARPYSSVGYWLYAKDFPTNIAPGLHRLVFTAKVEDLQGRAVSGTTAPGSGAFELSADVTLQPADRPSVRGIPNPQIADSIQRCLDPFFSYARVPAQFSVLSAKAPPANLSFAVYAVIVGKEAKLGDFSCTAGTNWGWGMQCHDAFSPLFPAMQPAKGFPLSLTPHITLILRSDPSPAINSTDIFDYWEGEIELKDVPVHPCW